MSVLTYIVAFMFYTAPGRQGMMMWQPMLYQGGCHTLLMDVRAMQTDNYFMMEWFECIEWSKPISAWGNG